MCHAYPNQISDQGKNLTQDWFYHGLSPSLCDALGFAMAELPEREQANMSFDTLYTLAKAWQPLHSHRSRSGPSNVYRDKCHQARLLMGQLQCGWASFGGNKQAGNIKMAGDPSISDLETDDIISRK